MLALLVGGVFVLVGLAAILTARKAFAKDRAIASWPRAPGKITVSRIETSTRNVRDQQGYYREYTTHKPIVQFTYTVAGVELQGNQLARVVYVSYKKPDPSRYPPGKDVMVYYDPEDPKTAYLELHRSGAAVVLAVMGGVFTVIGILVPLLVTFA